MTLFKLFFKLIRSRWHTFLIYISVFFAVFSLMLIFSQPSSQMYQPMDFSIGVLNNDHSEASQYLIDYLAKNNTVLAMESEEEIQDAMFLRYIGYGIVIPAGFENNVKSLRLIYDKSNGGGGIGYQAEHLLEEYLSMIDCYRIISPKTSHQSALETLHTQANVHIRGDAKMLDEFGLSRDYFNTLGYVLIALIISVIGECIIVIFNQFVFERLQCAPLQTYKVVLSVFCGSLVVGSLIAGGLCLMIFLIQPALFGTLNGVLFCSNAFVFAFSIIGLAVFISMAFMKNENLNQDRNKISMFSNVISLACAFISGIFVPQNIIHPTILKVASFTPSYWYVKVNNLLAQKQFDSFSGLEEVFQAQGIVLLFGLTFVSLAYAFYKQKKQKLSM